MGGGIVTVVGVLNARRCTSLAGSCPLGQGTALATVTTPPISQRSVFLCPFSFFFGKCCALLRVLDMLVTKREPTPGYNDTYSVGTPTWAFGRKAGKNTVRPRFPTWLDVFFWLASGPFTFFWVRRGGMDAPFLEGSTPLSW